MSVALIPQDCRRAASAVPRGVRRRSVRGRSTEVIDLLFKDESGFVGRDYKPIAEQEEVELDHKSRDTASNYRPTLGRYARGVGGEVIHAEPAVPSRNGLHAQWTYPPWFGGLAIDLRPTAAVNGVGRTPVPMGSRASVSNWPRGTEYEVRTRFVIALMVNTVYIVGLRTSRIHPPTLTSAAELVLDIGRLLWVSTLTTADFGLVGVCP